MSDIRNTPSDAGLNDMSQRSAPTHRWSNETKPAYKTTELIVYLASVIAVLIAAAVVDEAGNAGGGFGARHAWLYVTLLTIGYLVSRGLAKSGSRGHHDESR